MHQAGCPFTVAAQEIERMADRNGCLTAYLAGLRQRRRMGAHAAQLAGVPGHGRLVDRPPPSRPHRSFARACGECLTWHWGRLPDRGSAPCTGAVAVRMRVYDTGVSLVNCHLSSGQNEGDNLRRHADYAEIMRRGAFPPDGQSTDLDVSLAGAEANQVFACLSDACSPKLRYISAGAQGVAWLT